VSALWWSLAFAAATVGALHTLAPDHWVPIAAVSRSRGWSLRRTARVAFLCGFGHVTVSAALGLAALVTGTAIVEAIGEHTATVGGLLLIGFGVAYALWGLRRLAHHHDHDHDTRTTWALFLVYCADPCVAVIPIIFAAAPLSVPATLGIVVVYELATIATMVSLTVATRAGATVLHGRWIERYGDSAAGSLIVVTGIVVAVVGW
jgi:nickel/cobalt exporter